MKISQNTWNYLLMFLLIALMISGCSGIFPSPQAETPSPTPPPSTQMATQVPKPTETKMAEISETESTKDTSTPVPTATPYVQLGPDDWQTWPIIPSLSPEMMEVYQRGLELGRDPHVFSVIGDCQSSPTYFLSIYDEGRYTLSEDKAYLQDTIVWYAGSFSHLSITVKNGMTASGVLNPMWGDNELCESREVPVTCEVQMSNPTLVIISLGTNWLPATSYEQYVHYLSEIVNILLTHGVIPVLSTKADNVEGDYSRNLAMAQVAYDYSVPLWNFWAATKDLPNHGLDQSRDNVYLVRDGWDVRNQSALELLDSLRRQLMTIDLRTE